MNLAILYERDAYAINRPKPMGRQFAGHGFLTGLLKHSTLERLTGYVRDPHLGEEFTGFVRSHRPHLSADYITKQDSAKLKDASCLYIPQPLAPQDAWTRYLYGPRAWSMCGVTHTLASEGALGMITSWLTAPFYPWDAVVCTSRAAHDVIHKVLGEQTAFLTERLGATRFQIPKTPIIPLGVDCDQKRIDPGRREGARASLNIAPDEVAFLFFGRLSFHAKANPAPLYLALERIAKRKVVLIECGQFFNAGIEQAFAEARSKLCPSVRSIVLDGSDDEACGSAWAAADIFCSLSDNIQETFGLTPIEAMAAGLPVVVSDWDGYKDTVRHGLDGFAIPTVMAPPGSGRDLGVAYAIGLDSYDRYIAQASAATAVDVDATALALERLAADPDLRARMGASGAKHARETFDWKVVIRAYERLWDELAEVRSAGGSPETNPGWPYRSDPFALFASFPSATLAPGARILRSPGVSETEAAERLGLHVAMPTILRGVPPRLSLDLWKGLGTQEQSVESILAGVRVPQRASHVRALLLLVKLGLARLQD